MIILKPAQPEGQAVKTNYETYLVNNFLMPRQMVFQKDERVSQNSKDSFIYARIAFSGQLSTGPCSAMSIFLLSLVSLPSLNTRHMATIKATPVAPIIQPKMPDSISTWKISVHSIIISLLVIIHTSC